ncbi:MAG: KAP family NTPase, partial [Bacteroidales bacterium]|nr:KAP family NTPase [Bacteroidales bacterium]
MLSAPWGTGKSYYIQKHLIPFINQNSDDRCICISLYGLKTLDEISKALYLEIRAKKVNFNNEATNTVKVIGKTIIKGVSSFFGVNLDVSEEDLQKLYNSIDLSGKLVILEDIERSYINIKQILGFVNNLVEQDGVKVLLVANEQEILKWEEKTVSEGKNYSTKLELSDESKDYLRIKEKTVSDTILFTCDIKETIQNILKNFDNNLLNDLIQNQTNIAEEIFDVMQYVKSYNFRSLIFACQKATDLFGKVTNPNIKFFESTFLSIVAFSMRIKKDGQLKWNDKSNGSDLGTPKYPLPRFAYEFIKYQTFDEKYVLRNEEIFISRSEF